MVRSSQPVAKAGVAARDGEEGDAHQDQDQIEHGAPQNVATALAMASVCDLEKVRLPAESRSPLNTAAPEKS